MSLERSNKRLLTKHHIMQMSNLFKNVYVLPPETPIVSMNILQWYSVLADLFSENLIRCNIGTEEWMEIIITDVLHKFKDMSTLKPSITSVILAALVFEIIHSSNCIWIWKSATVYFQLMTKCRAAVTWCIVMRCPPRFCKSIYCSVNLFNRWKSRKKSILKLNTN